MKTVKDLLDCIASVDDGLLNEQNSNLFLDSLTDFIETNSMEQMIESDITKGIPNLNKLTGALDE